MIVSPDGSCKDNLTEMTKMAIEVKCPSPCSPGSYKVPVFYTIQKYYVPQILSEMYALQTDELLFICYSHDSTTVMKATFCLKLWQAMSQEIESVYGCNASPKKKSTQVSVLKDMVDNYLTSNDQFIAEVPSVHARVCDGRKTSINDPFCIHTSESGNELSPGISMKTMSQFLHEAKVLFETSYKINRLRASEFLGFIISNMDRTVSEHGLHAVPVAYGLKGYSLPTNALRKMIEYVLVKCEEKGLYAPVVSFDGQWYRLVVRDRDDYSLTLLQLQKDVFLDVKKNDTWAAFIIFQ